MSFPDPSALHAFKGITTEQVADFALDTLEKWMTGPSPATDEIPVQYTVAQIKGAPLGELWLRFTPFEYSADDYTQRPTNIYSVWVTVEEVAFDVV